MGQGRQKEVEEMATRCEEEGVTNTRGEYRRFQERGPEEKVEYEEVTEEMSINEVKVNV